MTSKKSALKRPSVNLPTGSSYTTLPYFILVIDLAKTVLHFKSVYQNQLIVNMQPAPPSLLRAHQSKTALINPCICPLYLLCGDFRLHIQHGPE